MKDAIQVRLVITCRFISLTQLSYEESSAGLSHNTSLFHELLSTDSASRDSSCGYARQCSEKVRESCCPSHDSFLLNNNSYHIVTRTIKTRRNSFVALLLLNFSIYSFAHDLIHQLTLPCCLSLTLLRFVNATADSPAEALLNQKYAALSLRSQVVNAVVETPKADPDEVSIERINKDVTLTIAVDEGGETVIEKILLSSRWVMQRVC